MSRVCSRAFAHFRCENSIPFKRFWQTASTTRCAGRMHLACTVSVEFVSVGINHQLKCTIPIDHARLLQALRCNWAVVSRFRCPPNLLRGRPPQIARNLGTCLLSLARHTLVKKNRCRLNSTGPNHPQLWHAPAVGQPHITATVYVCTQQVQIIRTSGTRLLSLVNDLMDTAALRKKKLVLKREMVRSTVYILVGGAWLWSLLAVP